MEYRAGLSFQASWNDIYHWYGLGTSRLTEWTQMESRWLEF
jgi:hypothetical protein